MSNAPLASKCASASTVDLNTFVAVGVRGAILSSTNGTNWIQLSSPVTNNLDKIIFAHDRFFIVIESDDAKYSETETRKLLEAAGSQHIEPVEE